MYAGGDSVKHICPCEIYSGRDTKAVFNLLLKNQKRSLNGWKRTVECDSVPFRGRTRKKFERIFQNLKKQSFHFSQYLKDVKQATLLHILYSFNCFQLENSIQLFKISSLILLHCKTCHLVFYFPSLNAQVWYSKIFYSAFRQPCVTGTPRIGVPITP